MKKFITIIHQLYRFLFPKKPILRVIKKLKDEKLFPDKIIALEVFGKDGGYVTQDYSGLTDYLEIWELDSNYEINLKLKFPQAVIKITDSFKQIRLATNKFNFIVVDNSTSTYGNYCEHFELFPDIFRIMQNQTILILNVIPEINAKVKVEIPEIFNERQLIKRRNFYKTNHPDNITLYEMIKRYKEMARENNFEIIRSFHKKRTFVYFLVLVLKKN